MLAMIVAVAQDRVIGRDNQLIWHLPKDLQYFKKLTKGHVIIMGRHTLESLPGLLPDREHWVITRSPDYVPPREDVRVFHSVEAAAKAAALLEQAFVIGGAQIYEQMMPYADRLYVTEVDHHFDGDVYFPPIDEKLFRRVLSVPGEMDEKNPWPFTFVTYDKEQLDQ